MLTVTKEFSFEMAHALEGYSGKCANIHGHSYRLTVSVCGSPIADPTHPHYGMVIDFACLKEIVREHIIAVFDHTVVLRKDSPLHKTLRTSDINIAAVDYQPTCENLLLDIVERLRDKMPSNVHLHKIKLYETATSRAEWTDDNK
jgi:6-pyruvoyltetrahydropterin/6-carboxytetrahydropterin synthase